MLYEFRTYPYKDREFCHLLFRGKTIDGKEVTSGEILEIGWFVESALPEGASGNISQTISRAMAGPDAENIQIHLQSMSPFRFVPK